MNKKPIPHDALISRCEGWRKQADNLELINGSGKHDRTIEHLHDRADTLEMSLWAYADGSANAKDICAIEKEIRLLDLSNQIWTERSFTWAEVRSIMNP